MENALRDVKYIRCLFETWYCARFVACVVTFRHVSLDPNKGGGDAGLGMPKK